MDRTVHPECVAAVDRTGRLLESLGHHVEVAAPAALSDEQFGAAFSTVVICSASADRRMLEQLFGRPVTADDFEPHNLLYSGLGDTVSAAQYIAALTAIHAWSRSMLSWWHPQDGSAGFDVLVTPTISQPPPPIGYIDPARPDVNDRVLELLLFTAQFNASGQPAVSLPLHWTADGLPVGVQVVGGFAAEPLLVLLVAALGVIAMTVSAVPAMGTSARTVGTWLEWAPILQSPQPDHVMPRHPALVPVALRLIQSPDPPTRYMPPTSPFRAQPWLLVGAGHGCNRGIGCP